MNSAHFSKQELAFFDEGDTLSDEPNPVEDFDFSDLDDADERVNSWVDRALALLPITRTES
jgi:hypothetical protein